MDTADDWDKLDVDQQSRRLLADLEEDYVEFVVQADELSASLHTARDQLEQEARGMTPRPFDEDTRHKLADAVYLPILGGEWPRNGQRTPSPTFTRRSLEGAIKAGLLEGVMHRGKLTVTVRALRAWLDSGAALVTKSGPVKPAATVAAKSNLERERMVASKEIALQMLASIGSKTKK